MSQNQESHEVEREVEIVGMEDTQEEIVHTRDAGTQTDRSDAGVDPEEVQLLTNEHYKDVMRQVKKHGLRRQLMWVLKRYGVPHHQLKPDPSVSVCFRREYELLTAHMPQIKQRPLRNWFYASFDSRPMFIRWWMFVAELAPHLLRSSTSTLVIPALGRVPPILLAEHNHWNMTAFLVSRAVTTVHNVWRMALYEAVERGDYNVFIKFYYEIVSLGSRTALPSHVRCGFCLQRALRPSEPGQVMGVDHNILYQAFVTNVDEASSARGCLVCDLGGAPHREDIVGQPPRFPLVPYFRMPRVIDCFHNKSV